MIAQTAIVVALLTRTVEGDFYAVLFGILSMQAVQRLGWKTALLWIALFTPLTALPLTLTYDVWQAVAFAAIYTGIDVILAFFTLTTRRAAEARARNEALLEELQVANDEIETYSRQIERLASARERHRLARELHDSVTQTVFSMNLTAQSAALLLQRDRAHWGHLWFIVHLLLYSLLALPLMLFLRRGAGRRVVDGLARAATVPGAILLFAVALIPAMSVPEIAGGNPVFYIAVFLLGYLVMADARFQEAIDAHRLVALVLGPIACLAVAYFEVTSWPAMPAWAEGPLDLYLSVLMPWCFMVALLAYGRRFLRSSGRVGAYAAEASYPAYLLHQTVIVAVAFVVVRWEAGVALKFAAILCVSLLVTMLIYELAIRRVGAARFLFGMKPLRRTARASGVPAERSIRGLPGRTVTAPVGGEAASRPAGSGGVS